MKYWYTVNRQPKLLHIILGSYATFGDAYVLRPNWLFFAETPEGAWRQALNAARTSVARQKLRIAEEERVLKNHRALLTRLERHFKEAKCTTK